MNPLWYIPIGFISLIILLFLSTVGADVRYSDEEALVRLRLNGITISKVPLEKFSEVEKPTRKRKKKKAKLPKEKADKEESFTDTFMGISEVLSMAKQALSAVYQKLIKKIVIDDLKVHISVATEDAVTTTMIFGNLAGLVNTVCSTLSYMVTLKCCDINIVPDYASTKTHANIRLLIKIRMFHAPLTVVALYPLYKEIKERKKKNERPSDKRSNLQHYGEAR